MADLVVTAANVSAQRGADIEHGTAGATFTAGQTVYRDEATKKYLPADADSVTAEARITRGVALHGASDNQPLAIIKGGGLNAGATVVIGTIYVQSDTPGGIMPAADLEVGDFVTTLGIGVTVDRIAVNIQVSGVAVPTP